MGRAQEEGAWLAESALRARTEGGRGREGSDRCCATLQESKVGCVRVWCGDENRVSCLG